MTMVIHSTQEIEYAYSLETTTFGTPVTESATARFTRMLPVGAIPDIVDNFSHIQYRRGRGHLFPSEKDYLVNNKIPSELQIPVFSTYSTIEAILQGVLQDATGTPMIFPNTMPDFTVDTKGYTYTIARTNPSANHDSKLSTAILKEVTFSCFGDQEDGRLVTTLNWYTGTPLGTEASNFTGSATWTSPETALGANIHTFWDLSTATFMAADVLAGGFYGFELTLRNNAKAVGWDGSKYGNYSLFGGDFIPVQGFVRAMAEDTSYFDIYTNYTSGTASTLVFELNSTGSSGHLKFACGNIVMDERPAQSTADELTVDIPFHATIDSTATGFFHASYVV